MGVAEPVVPMGDWTVVCVVIWTGACAENCCVPGAGCRGTAGEGFT